MGDVRSADVLLDKGSMTVLVTLALLDPAVVYTHTHTHTHTHIWDTEGAVSDSISVRDILKWEHVCQTFESDFFFSIRFISFTQKQA